MTVCVRVGECVCVCACVLHRRKKGGVEETREEGIAVSRVRSTQRRREVSDLVYSFGSILNTSLHTLNTKADSMKLSYFGKLIFIVTVT